MRRAIRPLARGVAIAGVLVAVVAVRVVSASHAELRRGEQLLAQRDADAAILALRRSARWYAPGNPYARTALERLSRIGADAERAGDVERALAAYRAIRGAILGSRSVFVPHRRMLEHADARIAALTARAAPDGPGEAEILAELRAPPGPHLAWTLVLLAGWIAWTAGAFLFAQRAIDGEDRLRPREARLFGTAVVLGFGLFVIGMALA
ncbi:MAG TPA: hypothetical protein VIL20_11945 [Sandaracinaceae bacterium]